MRRRILASLILAAASVLAVAGRDAAASHGPPVTFTEMVRDADLIAAGTVSALESVWARDLSAIYTFVTLNDLDVIDGDYRAPTFVLRHDGGEIRKFLKWKKMVVPGVPEFEKGDRVLVFVSRNRTEVCPLVGWHQGVLRLRPKADGKTLVYSFVRDLELAGVDGDRFVFKGPDPPAGPRIEESDPRARELRLQLERQQKEERERVRRREFTYEDLKRLIQQRAAQLEREGQRTPKRAVSADPHRDIESRAFAVVPPPRAPGGEKTR